MSNKRLAVLLLSVCLTASQSMISIPVYAGDSLSFDFPALKEIGGKTTGALTFCAGAATGLSGDALAAISGV